jgi:hypothetical protein
VDFDGQRFDTVVGGVNIDHLVQQAALAAQVGDYLDLAVGSR